MIYKTDTMVRGKLFPAFLLLLACVGARSQSLYQEPYRPQIHFSPQRGWMNDPNGLVYYKGTYHLFFQYYPDSTVWGPMHWGHAVSRDLVHWKQLPIALYPDSLGYIFSGSAVVDEHNTGGLATKNTVPLVAVFTQHDPVGEKKGSSFFQNQGMAYSLDDGSSWIKYKENPVLKTPGLRDFRDPKLTWFADQKKWIMTLTGGDRIMFYSSTDLKTWNKESEFGAGMVPRGSVWECPDLISLTADGKKMWLLMASINPGGPQGGSGTQYYVGNFDGKQFTCTDTMRKWADYGADNYAGVTWSNTGDEKIFIGWMSNWLYAMQVPSTGWRSAMTLPRVLGLAKIGEHYYTTMQPVSGLEKLVQRSKTYKQISSVQNTPLTGPVRLEFTVDNLRSFSFVFSNDSKQYLVAGYDEEKNAFYIDRTHAGISGFNAAFAGIHYGSRIAVSASSKITMILDNNSLEIFADQGLTTMTEIFFPDQPFRYLQAGVTRKPIENIRVSELKSIWSKN